MIKAVIIDHNMNDIKKISNYIQEINMGISIVGHSLDEDDAVNLISKVNPDLVFIDTKMSFIKNWKLENKIFNRKVILLTEIKTFEIAQSAIRMGASDIISKPVEYESLKESIELVVGYNLTSNEIVNSIIEYIDKNYQRNISLKEISEVFFLNRDYISRIFKENMGITILKYVNKVRIDKSIELIKQEYTLNQISNIVGYYDYNTFYRNFKIFTSVTPTEFVKKLYYEKYN